MSCNRLVGICLVAMISSFFGGLSAQAQSSPTTVSYQGVLSQNGVPVADGTYAITFRVYDVPTGGTPLHEVTLPGVQTTEGRFTALVPIPPATFAQRPNAEQYWGIVLNGVELAPRPLITATPLAMAASNLHNRGGSGPLTTGLLGELPAEGQIAEGTWGNYIVASNGADRRLRIGVADNGFTKAEIEFRNNNGPEGNIFFRTSPTNGAPSSTRMTIDRLGRVGIGNDQPNAVLHLRETVREQYGLRVDNQVSNRGIYITTVTGGNGAPLAIDHDGLRYLTVFQDGRTSVRVLQITGGSDLAEPFPASPAADGAVAPRPGLILSIDPANPGALRVATEAYDSKVAGVYSGGNGLPTGMLMGKDGCELTKPGDDRLPLAMTGRVWVYADESGGAIKPGDRLTTSGTKPGHAMKVTDAARADGAVIGKAMTPIDSKTGMVLVLINLQ